MHYGSRTLCFSCLVALGLSFSSVAADPASSYQRALAVCRQMHSPGAREFAGGEFWLRGQMRRAELSQQLWSKAGRNYLAAQRASVANETDEGCLLQLIGEAKRRRIG